MIDKLSGDITPKKNSQKVAAYEKEKERGNLADCVSMSVLGIMKRKTVINYLVSTI